MNSIHIAVADVYGVWMYAGLLFALTLWWAARWGDAAACPYIHMEYYLEGTNSFRHTALCCLAELAGRLRLTYLRRRGRAAIGLDKLGREGGG